MDEEATAEADSGEPHSSESGHAPEPVVSLRRRWFPRRLRWIVTTLVAAVAILYLLVPKLSGATSDLSLHQVNYIWLIFGVAAEIGAWVAYSGITYAVLKPNVPSLFRLFRINMSSLAVSHVVPGGTVGGTVLAYRLLGESGVASSVAGTGLATQGIGSALVLNSIFWLALLISIPLTGYNPLYGFAGLAGVILIGIVAGVVFLLTRGSTRSADRLERFSRHIPFVKPESVAKLLRNVADRVEILLADRQLLLRAGIWAVGFWLLDTTSLFCFIAAFGHLISPLDLLVAYGLANIIAVIPITPSGLGVIEAVLIPTISGFGVAKEVATLGVLSWRLINFWVPIPLGGLSYLSLRIGPIAKSGMVSHDWGSVQSSTAS